MITEEKISDIVHNYVNNIISEADFIKIKSEHTEIDWNTLIKEEKFYQNVFLANNYSKLTDKINIDIDKIESRNKLYKKIKLGSLLIVAILGIYLSYSLYSKKNEIQNENKNILSANEQTLNTIDSTDKKTVQTTIESQKVVEKKIISNQPIQNQQKIDVVKDTLLTTTSVQNEEVKIENPIINQKNSEVKVVYTPSKTDSIKDNNHVEIPQETQTSSKPKNQNFILNVTLNQEIEIETSEDDILISIKNLAGNEVYFQKLDKQTRFLWNGTQKNGEKLTTGLYLYVIEKDKMISKLGQITIVE